MERKLIALGAAAAIVALLVGSLIAVRLAETDDRLAACGVSAVAGGAIGGPFTLVDGAGQARTDGDLITEPTLLYFGYSYCPDVCPVDNARNAVAVDILADQGISATPVFVTVDPARDTPEVVSDFAAAFHDRMIGLTGTPEQVDAAAKAYKVYYKRHEDDDPQYYLVDHSTFTYLAMPEVGVVDFFRREDDGEAVAQRVACVAEALGL